MTTLTHDTTGGGGLSGAVRSGRGLGLAVISATTFGLSGALARPLLNSGWTPGAVVLVRILIGAAVVLPFVLPSLRGRWGLVRANLGRIVMYGLLAVAGAQFCYYSAVQYMQVGPALMIEYTAPVAVVVWMWLRHGERPGALTVGGAVVAAAGLLLVLGLFSGVDLDPIGIAWALGAMVGAAAYFLISADDTSGLPPMALAAGGLVAGGAILAILGVAGALPMRASTADLTYAGVQVAWWVPLLLLGVFTAAVSYVTGIAAARELGSRLASFVALGEVVAAVLWAWLLLAELPGPAQLCGGALILAGVIAVRAGEQAVRPAEGIPL